MAWICLANFRTRVSLCESRGVVLKLLAALPLCQDSKGRPAANLAIAAGREEFKKGRNAARAGRDFACRIHIVGQGVSCWPCLQAW